MEGKPLVSIIVPVFNSDKYLIRCIDSIKCQTLEHFECILIDDGSVDESGRICDEICHVDPRFKVVHQINSGVSKARNVGIEIASGDFIGFVDSDDWIEPSMFQTLYSDIYENDCEIAVCSWFGRKSDGSIRFLSGTEAYDAMVDKKGFCGFSWNKLFKRHLFNTMRFNEELGFYEDIELLFRILSTCRKIIWHDVALYHYELNDSSATARYGLTEKKAKGLCAIRELAASEKKQNASDVIQKWINSMMIDISIDYVAHGDIDNPGFQTAIEYIKKNEGRWNSRYSMRQKTWVKIVQSRFLVRLYWFMRGVKHE